LASRLVAPLLVLATLVGALTLTRLVGAVGAVVSRLDAEGWPPIVGSGPSPLLFVLFCRFDAACQKAFDEAWRGHDPPWLPTLALVLLLGAAVARLVGEGAPVPTKEPGGAAWALERDLRDYLGRGGCGYLGLTANGRMLRPLEDLRCQHALVVGGTGAGKTAGYFKPNLLLDAHDGVSAVVFDLKYPDARSGLLEMVPFFGRFHDVQPVLPFEAETLRLPLLAGADDPRVAAEIAALLVPAPKLETDGAYYARAERGLLEALILAFRRTGSTSPRELLHLVQSGPGDLATFLERSDEEAHRKGRLFFALRADQRAGVLEGLAGRLGLFDDERLDRATTASPNPGENVDLEGLGQRPNLLYLGLPQEEVEGPSGQALLQLLKRAVDRALIRAATRHGGRLPTPVSVYLDEFAAMGALPNVERNFATMRSRRVAYHVALQNRAQGEAIYGAREFAAAVVSNFAHVLVFPRHLRFEDASFFAEAQGEMTVREVATSRSRRGLLDQTSGETVRAVARPLLSKAEMQRWPSELAVLGGPGLPPAKVWLPRLDQPRIRHVRNPLHEGYARTACHLDPRPWVFERIRRRRLERPALKDISAHGGDARQTALEDFLAWMDGLPASGALIRPRRYDGRIERLLVIGARVEADLLKVWRSRGWLEARDGMLVVTPAGWAACGEERQATLERVLKAARERRAMPETDGPHPEIESPAKPLELGADLPESLRTVLHLILERGGAGVPEVVSALGLPETTARRHLNALLERGWLRRSESEGRKHHFVPIPASGLDAIPETLRALSQWVVWRLEPREGEAKPAKVPHQPYSGERASTTEPAHWAAFEEARQALERGGFAGLGFVLTPESGIVGIDLDACLEPTTGQLEPWAAEIVRRLSSYTEYSPSRTGVHILVRARLPEGRRRQGRVEIYDRGRYFTVTGGRLPGTPPAIEAREAEIAALYGELFGPSGRMNHARGFGRLTDEDKALLERARSAHNGASFRALYDQGELEGHPSASEADFALCRMLRFWTGSDSPRMDRLFRASALMREKWDERRGAQTYGQLTIQHALEAGGDVFQKEPPMSRQKKARA
jgi:type IV secretory pathway TraG/TraD family ATPase VirD4/DNA-binding MarR family transcriptional regulator